MQPNTFPKKQLHTLNQKLDFGAHKGKTVQVIIENHRYYFDWMLENEVARASKQVMRYANTPRAQRPAAKFTAKVETLTGRNFEHPIYAESREEAQELCNEMFDYTKLQTFELI